MEAIAKSTWEGTWKEGKGTISTYTDTVQNAAYSYASRFLGDQGASPEELLAAAHAACFNQALANVLNRAGFVAEHMETVGTVKLGFNSQGNPEIQGTRITVEAHVPGITIEDFKRHAKKASLVCAISRIIQYEVEIEAQLIYHHA